MVVTASLKGKLTLSDVILIPLIKRLGIIQSEVLADLVGAGNLLHGYVFTLGAFLNQAKFGDTFLLVAPAIEQKVVDTLVTNVAQNVLVVYIAGENGLQVIIEPDERLGELPRAVGGFFRFVEVFQLERVIIMKDDDIPWGGCFDEIHQVWM